MIAAERRRTILDLLRKDGIVSIDRLCMELDVSDMTVRRDLQGLEKGGLLSRVRGGAKLIPGDALPHQAERPFSARLLEYSDKKNEIGQMASRLVKDGDSIFLDGSSTSMLFARHLIDRFDRLTVVTDSMAVMEEFSGAASSIELVVLGGSLQRDGNTIDGPLTLENVARLQVGILFFSCAAFDAQGVYNSGLIGTNVKRTLIQRAKRRVLLANSEKYGAHDFYQLCTLDGVDTVVSDWELPQKATHALRRAGLEVIVAQEPDSERSKYSHTWDESQEPG